MAKINGVAVWLCWFKTIFTARNEVGARLCFYRCVWFCSRGGSTWPGALPHRTRYTPQDQVHPQTRYTPQTRYLPGTRYTPQDQVHPPGPRYPPQDQVHPPGPGRYGLRAGGTHPTGMQSFWYKFYLVFCRPFWKQTKRHENLFDLTDSKWKRIMTYHFVSSILLEDRQTRRSCTKERIHVINVQSSCFLSHRSHTRGVTGRCGHVFRRKSIKNSSRMVRNDSCCRFDTSWNLSFFHA